MLLAMTRRRTPCRGHLGQEHGRAQIVVPRVGREVAHVDTEADHRRLMENGVGIAKGRTAILRTANVTLEELCPAVDGRLLRRMDGLQEGIHHAHIVARVSEGARRHANR